MKAETEIEAKPAESFRTRIEEYLDTVHQRLTKLEGTGGRAAVDDKGSSVAGIIRTFESRLQQVETNTAENISAVVRLSDLVQAQIVRINDLETKLADLSGDPKPPSPTSTKRHG